MSAGKLLLLPDVLDETLPSEMFLPAGLNTAVQTICGLIVESEKVGRRYLRRFLTHEQMAQMPLRVLNEHTQPKDLEEYMEPLRRGEIWGLISDAGLPCIADPGSEIVALCHSNGIHVETFAGPSSILMALQLSGFSGQRFTFHGYLPREIPDLERKIFALEKEAHLSTQIWIEAPYRSQKMLDLLKTILSPKTRLCVAASLTFPNSRTVSLPMEKWKTFSFSLQKEPAVFLIFA